MTTRAFQRVVWDYFEAHGRRELPWRRNLDPYAILISEVMLQQTQVERVMPKFEQWLKQFPDFAALAEAPLPAVLQQWQGLGYNRRALAVQRCAAAVVRDFNGRLPRDEKNLLALPGIGPYTAGAIRAFAFNEPAVFIETNIRTVFLHHYFGPPKKGESTDIDLKIPDKDLLPLVKKTVDSKRPREWYWALMDYGTHLKKTVGNPAARSRQYVRQSSFKGSNRQVRGAIVRALTKVPQLSADSLALALDSEGITLSRVGPALEELEREGFIAHNRQRRTISLAKSPAAGA